MERSDLIPLAIAIGLVVIMLFGAIVWLVMRRRIRSLEQDLRGERERANHLSRQLDEYQRAEADRNTISDILSYTRSYSGMKRSFALRQRKRIWGYVYLMCINGEYHKIGYAQNVKSRLGEMQVASPYKIEVMHMISCYHAPRLEMILQNRFADRWVTGEWFKLNEEDIATIQLIESPIKVVDLDRLEGIEGSNA